MEVDGPYPFKGEVIWLTPAQGGRRSGPPADPTGYVENVGDQRVEPGGMVIVTEGTRPVAHVLVRTVATT